MGLPGHEKLEQDLGAGEGRFIKLEKDKPTALTVLEYLGQFAGKQYPDKPQYVFQVETNGALWRLGGSWRLAKALSDAGKDIDGAFSCTITKRKVVEEVQGKDMLVNVYDVINVRAADANVPF